MGAVDLDLMRDAAREFPQVDDPAAVTSIRVWHCKYRTLSPLSRMVNLQKVTIATFPDGSLELLAPLTDLEELQIIHLPAVSDLAPLAELMKLRRLRLATLPGWDSSGKVTEVASLAPIAALPALEEVELFGVVPPGRRVDDLLASTSLRRVRVSKYPRREIARLAHLT